MSVWARSSGGLPIVQPHNRSGGPPSRAAAVLGHRSNDPDRHPRRDDLGEVLLETQWRLDGLRLPRTETVPGEAQARCSGKNTLSSWVSRVSRTIDNSHFLGFFPRQCFTSYHRAALLPMTIISANSHSLPLQKNTARSVIVPSGVWAVTAYAAGAFLPHTQDFMARTVRLTTSAAVSCGSSHPTNVRSCRKTQHSFLETYPVRGGTNAHLPSEASPSIPFISIPVRFVKRNPEPHSQFTISLTLLCRLFQVFCLATLTVFAMEAKARHEAPGTTASSRNPRIPLSAPV